MLSERGVIKLVLETDCSNAVRKLTKRETDRSIHGTLVEDVRALMPGFDDFKI
jgi:hypothetical protein